jgi:hypothetical protein
LVNAYRPHAAGRRTPSLRQADQIRGDLYGIQDDLDFIKGQLARLPTRGQLAQAAGARHHPILSALEVALHYDGLFYSV